MPQIRVQAGTEAPQTAELNAIADYLSKLGTKKDHSDRKNFGNFMVSTFFWIKSFRFLKKISKTKGPRGFWFKFFSKNPLRIIAFQGVRE